MGYYSRVIGKITITPPLRWEEYSDSPFVDNHNRRDMWRDIRLIMTWWREDVTSLPEAPRSGGPGIIATGIEGFDDEYKCYNIEKHLTEFLAAFGENHAFTGSLIRSGEEQGDLQRYTLDNNELVVEKARLVWSDGPIENIEDVDMSDL